MFDIALNVYVRDAVRHIFIQFYLHIKFLFGSGLRVIELYEWSGGYG